MKKEDIENGVIEVFRDKLCLGDEIILMNSDLHNDLGCDSLDAVELIMELELYFGVSIPDEDAEKAYTVGDMVNIIDGIINK